MAELGSGVQQGVGGEPVYASKGIRWCEVLVHTRALHMHMHTTRDAQGRRPRAVPEHQYLDAFGHARRRKQEQARPRKSPAVYALLSLRHRTPSSSVALSLALGSTSERPQISSSPIFIVFNFCHILVLFTVPIYRYNSRGVGFIRNVKHSKAKKQID